ncbi:carboxylesterase family protein [Nitriliruptor alkaliphilus]|uniref:carboxylesterase family protein n=1 Tax=Nitriliruptor alkaliphilus TaxID=427918 RepID=UPI0006988A67|nr:carboxylesterase family protein [Nitriliruptor alkaliphilus]
MTVDPLAIPTRFGPVVGTRGSGARRWLGIPFAAPPVGRLRWKAPVDPIPWSRPLIAAGHPAPCAQYVGFGDQPGLLGHEDCLYVNVFRPDNDEADLPVYVWIHGGGNRHGSVDQYRGEILARKLQAVVVMPQHRLGWLGFLTHPALRERAAGAEDASGNYGYLDLIKALRWVADHAAAFGGDPGLVTAAGESAGASNALFLLGTDAVRRENLVHRIVHLSGGISPSSRSVADEDDRAAALIDALADRHPEARAAAADDLDFLTSLSAYAIADAQLPELGLPVPISDGTVVPLALDEAFRVGAYHKVPALLGTSTDEFTIFACEQPPWLDLYDAARRGAGWDAVPLTEAEVATYRSWSSLVSSLWRHQHGMWVADRLAAHREPVFVYSLDWDGDDGSVYQAVYGAAHTLSIPFFHGDWESGAFVPFGFNDENLAGRQALSDIIIDYQAEFIRRGEPGRGRSGRQVGWDRWRLDRPISMVLDADHEQAHVALKPPVPNLEETAATLARSSADVRAAVEFSASQFSLDLPALHASGRKET